MMNTLRLKVLGWATLQPVYVFTLAAGIPIALLPYVILPLREKFASRKPQPEAEFLFDGKKY
ncbi:hypothetical protein DDB_G0270800 [Dictyostelium discoideum AX4]|uniref:Uncharacterized protein n=1 Tax=Dictyostelium discoideum TaxID=44689 RepID=Q55BS6_DICDI|nr:hypothetical protein DDB_G0270800 [Dictyostelium discoideum AX4]EAL72750.1 hypothetical protein DDB_G0270800 [Dictyostelium discoideum AX4]|eukprot:XP_646755.1 hypothetical protein DDB_G0270800 [Dictyostelium discoideum AX4]